VDESKEIIQKFIELRLVRHKEVFDMSMGSAQRGYGYVE